MPIRGRTVAAGMCLMLLVSGLGVIGATHNAGAHDVGQVGSTRQTGADAAQLLGGNKLQGHDVMASSDEVTGSLVVAQESADDQEPELAIAAGGANPTGLIDVVDAVQDLTALHVLLSTAITQGVNIDMVTIGFGDQMGNTSFVQTLRVELIEDANTNGIRDDGEAVLGTRDLRDLTEFVNTITFDLSPPLALAQDSQTALLVILDINSPGTQTAGAVTSPRHAQTLASWRGWIVLSPILGLGLFWRLPCSSTRRCMCALIVLLCLTLALSGCSGSGEESELTFTVNLPSNGLTDQGMRLGPPTAIPGLQIRLT